MKILGVHKDVQGATIKCPLTRMRGGFWQSLWASRFKHAGVSVLPAGISLVGVDFWRIWREGNESYNKGGNTDQCINFYYYVGRYVIILYGLKM